ncbi:MAG: outer membrane beta-barrel protein [Mangrovimonas sp.]|nr:outer membrane beta-barrel protein [Mangrovimonas sp.]
MKRLLMCLACLCASYSFSQSQHFKIFGKLVSAEDQAPLEAATIYLERPKDSSLITYTISRKDGTFLLEDKVSETKLNLFISYVGFKTHYQNIDLTSEEIDLKTISLQESTNQLDEIVIKSEAPITVKKDTLEFNVSSFKTAKDATVEDLLKKLPGVEVDDEGNITVNGKPVNKILVNGKPFFGDDPTITTRNLTKDIIEKIQVTDTKTKSEAFAGEKGDTENKTINLTIKEENNKGVFGRVAAGAGTDKRYEYAGLVNLFDNEQRLSILAGGNNINSPGFSFGEIRKMFGGGNSISVYSDGAFRIDGRSFGGGEGITVSNNVGANYADELAKGIDISADYFMSGADSDNRTVTNRENILPDSRYYTNSVSNSSNSSYSHRVNMNLEIEVDSTFLINVRPSFGFSNSKNEYTREEASSDELGALINSSNLSSFVETTGNNFKNRLSLTKRFGDRGAFLKFRLDTEVNSTNSDDFVNSETNFEDTSQEAIFRDQFTDGKEESNNISANLTYRLPLVAKTLFLDFGYNIQSDNNESVKSTYDFDDGTQDFTNFNTDLSTDFDYKNRSHTPNLELTYKKEKWSASIEAGYNYISMENKDGLRPDLSYADDFKNLQLGADFDYRFTETFSMYTGYNLRNNPPSIRQLQPFEDVSNPLNTVTGNPNLVPSNVHSVYLGMNNFNFQNKTGFYIYANVNLTNNVVVSKSTVDENLVRHTTYTNVDGNYRTNFSGSYNKTVKIDSLKSIRYRLGVYSSLRRSVNFNNDVQYASRNTSMTPNVRATFTWKDVLEITPNYRLTFNQNKYDIDDFDNQEFVSHNLGIQTATFVPKKLEWRNDINFSYNPNVSPGFQKSAWFWNSTLAYSILNDKATVTLKVYDLLNQNTNARRSANEDYIQDTQSTVLNQYFMLSFSWKFNTLGKKGETGRDNFFMF